MTLVKEFHINTFYFFIAFLSISFAFSSCEAENEFPEVVKSSFQIPEYTSINDSIELSLQTNNNFDAIEWAISDGSTYFDNEIKHKFKKAGNYTISVRTFLNGNVASSNIKDIKVIFNNKTISSDVNITAQQIYYAENRIIIRVQKQPEENGLKFSSSFIVLDRNLNIISDIETPEEISKELGSFIKLGDSVLAFNSGIANNYSLFQYKSSNTDNILQKSNTYFNYSNGYIYQHNESNNIFKVDYFNESLEKLWTKTFENKSSIGNKYIFNLNNRLFYLAFDNTSNEVYIEKFKTPSVTFSKNSLTLNTPASAREELFAICNNGSGAISFATYCSSGNKTIFYNISEDCSFTSSNIIDGRFEGKPEFCTTDGSIIVTKNNKIEKYSSKWILQAEKELSNSNIGVCQLSDNLYLLFENIPTGEIRLSYVDKNLDSVYLN